MGMMNGMKGRQGKGADDAMMMMMMMQAMGDGDMFEMEDCFGRDTRRRGRAGNRGATRGKGKRKAKGKARAPGNATEKDICNRKTESVENHEGTTWVSASDSDSDLDSLSEDYRAAEFAAVQRAMEEMGLGPSSRMGKKSAAKKVERCPICTLPIPCRHTRDSATDSIPAGGITIENEKKTGESNSDVLDELSDKSFSDEEIDGDGVLVLDVGDRVKHGKKFGKVAFLGSVHYTDGIMVGVCLDEPVGKNDGTVKGVSYFQCKPGHGLMVRATELSSE